MKTYIIRYFNSLSITQPIEKLGLKINQSQTTIEKLDCINWAAFPYKPSAAFIMVALSDGLYLRFDVTETHCLARFTDDGSPVYTDSCVELFIDPTNEGFYYNFEFNCIGTMLLGYGASRHNREPAPPGILAGIIRRSSFSKAPIDIKTETSWNLEILIPYSAFFKHSITTPINNPMRCNLYKCGDETNSPHYITWSPIKTERPDFHRPEYFGNAFVEAL